MRTKQRKTKAQTTSNEAAKRLDDTNLRHQIGKRAYESGCRAAVARATTLLIGFKQKMKCWRTVKEAQMRLSEPT